MELWRASGRNATKVAAELGTRPALLYRWRAWSASADEAQGGRKTGRRMEELEAENRHLRPENAKLLEQREVLKKSLGILSEMPPRRLPESKR